MRYRWFAFGKTPELRVVVAVAVVMKAEFRVEVVARPTQAVLDRVALTIVGQRTNRDGSIRTRMVGIPDRVATGIFDANRQAAWVGERVVRLARFERCID